MKLAECILFDFDGTVYDTVEGITRSVRYAINKHGLDAELEDLRCFAGPPLDDMFMEKFGFTREEAVLATMEFRERYKPVGVYESTPFPGIRELLEHLRASGKVVGIATSKPQELAELLLERSGMTELFDVVSGSNVGAGNNAKWEVLAAAIEKSGVPKEETVLIGDTKYDVAGAKKVGIPCIGVRWGYAAPGELEAAGADAIAEDIEELENMLI